jgi:hypothetical protein
VAATLGGFGEVSKIMISSVMHTLQPINIYEIEKNLKKRWFQKSALDVFHTFPAAVPMPISWRHFRLRISSSNCSPLTCLQPEKFCKNYLLKDLFVCLLVFFVFFLFVKVQRTKQN